MNIHTKSQKVQRKTQVIIHWDSLKWKRLKKKKKMEKAKIRGLVYKLALNYLILLVFHFSKQRMQ
jgi:hypothetical protein